MKTGTVISIGVATFVVGGVVGAGIMKGVSELNLKKKLEKTLEQLLYGDEERKPLNYAEYFGGCDFGSDLKENEELKAVNDFYEELGLPRMDPAIYDYVNLKEKENDK